MQVEIKKLTPEAIVPSYAHPTDAGLDLTATSVTVDDFGNITYGTGIAIAIPEGYLGFLVPRSSVSKQDLSLANSVGVIDSAYRGEIIFKYKPSQYIEKQDEDTLVVMDADTKHVPRIYKTGERIGQIIIMPRPKIEFSEVSELSETDRGVGGFGSTGK